MDPMFTMRPQRLAIMSGAAARLQSQPPVRLTSMTRRHSSSATWVIQGVGDRRLGETRALFTKMSIGPKRWCTESKGQRRPRGGRARHPAGLRAPGPSSPYLRRLISGGRLQRASRVRRSRALIRLHRRRDFLQSSARGGVSVNGYSWAGVIGALEQTPLDEAQEESAMYGLLWMVGGAAVVVALWASMAGAQDVWQDRRDIARDVRDIQQDERDLARDERELRQDRRQLREDMRAGDWGAVARDRAEIRRDRRDLYQDRQELARDERDLRNDRQELRHDLIDRNRDRRELYRDERDLRADRRDLRQDLRNRWADQHPGFSNRFQNRYEPYGQHQGGGQYQNGQHQGYGERWYGENSQGIGQHQGGGQYQNAQGYGRHQRYGHNSQGSDQHHGTGQNSEGTGQNSQGTSGQHLGSSQYAQGSGQYSQGSGQRSRYGQGSQGSSQYAQGSGQRSMYGQNSQGSSQAPRTYARVSGYGQSAQSYSRPAGYSQASYARPSAMMSGRTMQARGGRR